MVKKSRNISPLQEIPGIGPSVAGDLHRLGIHAVSDLKDKDAEELYQRIGKMDGKLHDRCLLYVFRCAIYYATRTKHNPELLKWWNWTDGKIKSS